jgi:hypothetical protein
MITLKKNALEITEMPHHFQTESSEKYVVQFDHCGQGAEWSSSPHFDAKFFDTKEQVAEFLISI